MGRRTSPLLLGFLVAVPTGCVESGGERANLLLVTLDTTRADRLGAYGYAAADTPSLDALAARGVVFEDAHSPAPMTLPAHATMLTGLPPPEHGARVNGLHELAPDVPTLGEWLGEAGYRTGAFVAAFVLDERFGLARGFDHYDDDLSGAYERGMSEGLSRYRPGNLVVDAALAWLGEGDPGQPFFCWVHLYDAHYPWHPHGDAAEDPGAETGTYDGEVAFVDRQVGRLLAFLADEGLAQRTLVVAVADHGEGLGDHGEIEHAYLLNEEVLRVPWIMAGPGVPVGQRVETLVTLSDLQPSVLELLGLPGGGARGRSLVPLLRGEPLPHGTSYAETRLPWTSFRWAPQVSLTTEEWKYVRSPREELYDRTRDRAELANLAASRGDVRAELDGRLRELESSFRVRSTAVAEVAPEELEQLAALGYAAGSEAEVPDDLAGLADVKERLAFKSLATELRRGVEEERLSPERQVAMARRLVEGSPETPSFHMQLGEAFVRAGAFAEAVPILTRVVEMAPTDAGVHYTLGDALQQLGDQEQARKHLELALELEPEMAAAHVGLGNVWRAEGRSDLAAGEYTEAIRLRERYPEAHYNLALTFLDRNRPDLAREHLDLALEYKPGWGVAHRSLANLFLGLGRPEEALPHFEAGSEALPRDLDLLNDWGVALQRLGRPLQARDRYAAALERDPTFLRPRLNLANLAFDLGNDAMALAHYEEANRQAPELPETCGRLARFLATSRDPELRDPERAVRLAEFALSRMQAPPASLLDTLAASYAAAGRFADAVTTAHRGGRLALEEGNGELADAIDARLALYARGEVYLAPDPPDVPSATSPPAAARETGASTDDADASPASEEP